jgi:uncharacterized protein YoaH (UPF0181 family)
MLQGISYVHHDNLYIRNMIPAGAPLPRPRSWAVWDGAVPNFVFTEFYEVRVKLRLVASCLRERQRGEEAWRVMRAFVLVEPKFFTPPEIFPTLLEGFAAWRDANREHMESFEFFAGGGGGFGIFNGPDEATLNRIMVQYPFFAYSLITVRPILDGDSALEQWREIMSEGMGAGPAV